MQSLSKDDLFTILKHLKSVLIKDLEGNIIFEIPGGENNNTLHYLNNDPKSKVIASSETKYTLRNNGVDYVVEKSNIVLHGKTYILEYITMANPVPKQTKELVELTRRANNDQLTGVINRHKFFEDLKNLIDINEPFSIIYGDLDNLKVINDVHGHNYGDLALQAIARALKKNLRRTDIIARFGGDEFVIAIPLINYKKLTSIMLKIQNDLATEEIYSEKGLVPISMSFGFSYYDFNIPVAENLGLADKALLHVKQSGDKGRIAFSDGEEIHFIDEHVLKKVDYQE